MPRFGAGCCVKRNSQRSFEHGTKNIRLCALMSKSTYLQHCRNVVLIRRFLSSERRECRRVPEEYEHGVTVRTLSTTCRTRAVSLYLSRTIKSKASADCLFVARKCIEIALEQQEITQFVWLCTIPQVYVTTSLMTDCELEPNLVTVKSVEIL